MTGAAKLHHERQEFHQEALDVKKIEGNPKSRINRGRLYTRRLAPLGFPAATDGLAAIGGILSLKRCQVIGDFLAAAGSSRCYFKEHARLSTLREADRRLFGRHQLDARDPEDTTYLLSFRANLIERHTSPVRWSLGLSHVRQGLPGERGKLARVESRLSLSPANGDEWIVNSRGLSPTPLLTR